MAIVIIGGGAAGTFAALRAKELIKESGQADIPVIIFEKGNRGLRKVKISGGGRCNVTHHPYPVRDFLKHYPRGERELISPFMQFHAQNTIQWFAQRGVEIVEESDGRMFPATNDSQTIIDCFEKEKERLGIKTLYGKAISSIEASSTGFQLEVGNEKIFANSLIMATGSDRSGYDLSQSLGHKLSEMAPSLFTFKVKHPLLKPLQGTTLEQVDISLKVGKKKFDQTGPLLITHWGLSGPAILKLSAWAARELKQVHYRFDFYVNFIGIKEDKFSRKLSELKIKFPNKEVPNLVYKGLTKNFWKQLLDCEFPDLVSKKWGELTKKDINKLSQTLTRFPFSSTGSHRFKEEFVECGGIHSKEVNFKTMESTIHSGLFFAGELLDVDGITGGFNFQNCWSTGFLAGENAAKKALKGD